MIARTEMPEFIGQVIDIFDDFLALRSIDLENDEMDECDEDNDAVIYGSDYGELQSQLENLLFNWGLIRDM